MHSSVSARALCSQYSCAGRAFIKFQIVSDTVASPTFFPSLLRLLPVLSAYSLAVSVMYLWGYWGEFHVRILEYIELTSVVKLALLPLVAVLLVLVPGAALGEWLSNRTFSEPPSRASLLTKVLAWSLMLSVAVVALMLTVWGTARKWEILPMFLAAPFWAAAHRIRAVARVMDLHGSVKISVFLLILLPIYAYGRGVTEADRVRRGTEYEYVVSGPDGSGQVQWPHEQLRLVGRAGAHHFFFDPRASAVVITKAESDQSVVLKHVRAPADTPNPWLREAIWGVRI